MWTNLSLISPTIIAIITANRYYYYTPWPIIAIMGSQGWKSLIQVGVWLSYSVEGKVAAVATI